MIKWLQQHPQWRDRAFWVSLLSVLSLFVIQIASLLGYQIETIVGQYQEKILTLIGLVIAIVGVFLPPPKSHQQDSSSDQNQINQ